MRNKTQEAQNRKEETTAHHFLSSCQLQSGG